MHILFQQAVHCLTCGLPLYLQSHVDHFNDLVGQMFGTASGIKLCLSLPSVAES